MSGISIITKGLVSGTVNAPIVVKPVIPFEIDLNTTKLNVIIIEPDKIEVTLKDN